MEVVVEYTLIVNLLLNLFILKLVSLLVKEKARLAVLSSLLGSLFSLVYPIYQMESWVKLVFEFCVMVIMIQISFKFISPKSFAFKCCLFMLTTFLFGGGCYAFQSVFGQTNLLCVLVISFALYVIFKTIYKKISKKNHIQSFTYNLVFKDKGVELREEGFLDSGNMLYDSVTKEPIILVNYNVFHKLFSNISYLSLLTKKFDKSSIKNAHYIKINTVGEGTSLLIFTIDELKVGEDKSFKNVSVGLSFSGFEKSFGKNVLLHYEYV